MAGGWGPGAHSASAAIWDLQADAWTPLPDLPTARAGACGAVLEGRLLVVGGGQSVGAGEWTSLAAVDRLVAR